MGFLSVELCQPGKRFIQSNYLRPLLFGNADRFFQEYFLYPSAALLSIMAAAIVNQDTTHNLRSHAQKLLPVLPMNFSLIVQAKIGLMHQGGGLQGMLTPLPSQVT